MIYVRHNVKLPPLATDHILQCQTPSVRHNSPVDTFFGLCETSEDTNILVASPYSNSTTSPTADALRLQTKSPNLSPEFGNGNVQSGVISSAASGACWPEGPSAMNDFASICRRPPSNSIDTGSAVIASNCHFSGFLSTARRDFRPTAASFERRRDKRNEAEFFVPENTASVNVVRKIRVSLVDAARAQSIFVRYAGQALFVAGQIRVSGGYGAGTNPHWPQRAQDY